MLFPIVRYPVVDDVLRFQRRTAAVASGYGLIFKVGPETLLKRVTARDPTFVFARQLYQHDFIGVADLHGESLGLLDVLHGFDGLAAVALCFVSPHCTCLSCWHRCAQA